MVVLKQKRWEVHDLRGNVGDTDISGWMAYQPCGDRSALLANLHSNKLVVEDLYAVVGKKEKDKKSPNKGLFPEARLTAERLRAVDFNVSYAAQSIAYPSLPLERIKTYATLDDGRLLAKLDSLGIANGEVTGEAALNARQAVPSADLDLKLRDVSLSPFFQDTQFADEMNGRVGGQLYLLGTGWTLADLFGSVQGNGRLHIQDATLSGLVLEAIGLDVIE